MGSLRAALIGTGRIARQHLACLSQHSRAELVAVCDASPASAQYAAERFGAAAWFTDHRRMLAEAGPEMVHVTTPSPSHFELARDVLEAGSHALVEKPLADSPGQVEDLLATARRRDAWVIENLNYLFNPPTRRVAALVDAGDLGEVVHVEVTLCLHVDGPGSAYADPNLRHSALARPGGAIGEFLPHMASLAHAFVGPGDAVATRWSPGHGVGATGPPAELRALVEGATATATLSFSARGAPEGLWLRVHGTRGRATAGLFEPSLVVERGRNLPRPANALVNGLAAAGATARGAIESLAGKLAGRPGAYAGLWELIDLTYRALEDGGPPPLAAKQILEVHHLVASLLADAPAAPGGPHG